MNHSDIELMAQGFPPLSIGKDHEEVVIWLATQLLDVQQKLGVAIKHGDTCMQAEIVWEKAMMAAIGEDGVGSVSKAIATLKAERDALQQKLDAANAELARYSMSAGQADQFAAEAKAVRKALGYAENAENVAPVDLLEKIAGLRAEGVEMLAEHHLRKAEVYANSGNVTDSKARITMYNITEEFAAQLRAETDTTPSQYESLAGGK